jgi:hypothetical protein
MSRPIRRVACGRRLSSGRAAMPSSSSDSSPPHSLWLGSFRCCFGQSSKDRSRRPRCLRPCGRHSQYGRSARESGPRRRSADRPRNIRATPGRSGGRTMGWTAHEGQGQRGRCRRLARTSTALAGEAHHRVMTQVELRFRQRVKRGKPDARGRLRPIAYSARSARRCVAVHERVEPFPGSVVGELNLLRGDGQGR